MSLDMTAETSELAACEVIGTPGWISDDASLAGDGAAQAVPGPLFTFGAYLGAVVSPEPHGLAGAAMGLIAIFLPGMLIYALARTFSRSKNLQFPAWDPATASLSASSSGRNQTLTSIMPTNHRQRRP